MVQTLQARIWVGMAALTLASFASAQGVFNMGMLTNTMSQGAIVKSERERSIRLGQGDPLSKKPAKSNPASLLYKPSADIRKQNLASFVAKIRVADSASADGLEKAFAQADVMGEVRKQVRNAGLNPDNVADTMATYLVVAWYGVRGNTDSKAGDYLAVGTQLRGVMAKVPAMTRVSNAAKQELAETMLLQALLAEQAVTTAQKQPSSLPGVKSAIANGARATFGFDLAKLRLGKQGFY
ncbi:hypothetical protein EON81_13150 [bacterium]|nr:MAG: hypothetical protein EON81_13150 [bacterium]